MNVRQAFDLVSRMGLPWAAYRASFALKNRLGWLERRFPLADWPETGLESVDLRDAARRFFVPSLDTSHDWHDGAHAANQTDAVRAGEWILFSGVRTDAGFPPNWHRHPFTNVEWPRVHWSRLPDMGGSDVKSLWEFGRFAIAYAAVRAWRQTRNDTHAETLWQLVESWRDENPPNCGVHWMCGQECAIRALAWCFALMGLRDAPATTSDRIQIMVAMLAAHGNRIEGNIDFALSQKNNHSINEALALFTIGSVFPMLPRATEWEALGRQLLETEILRQVYDDGSYVQHSLNYHRMIVQSYAWALRIAELAGRPLSDALRERFLSAVELLYGLTDSSGRAPNYGSNDGGQLCWLDACDFEDYRPALALGFWAAANRRVYPSGPWDEAIYWMYGNQPLDKPVEPHAQIDVAANDGGYYTLRGGDTWAFTRSCTYRDRPAQADELHVDIWWRGLNLVADPGTYSYNNPAPWNNGLSRTGVHNTIEIDGLDQMERGPRFTWFDWTRTRIIRNDADAVTKVFESEHSGYARRLGVLHRRAVLLVAKMLWVIIDDLYGDGVHGLSSQWLLPQATIGEQAGSTLHLETPAGPCSIAFLSLDSTGDRNELSAKVVTGDPDSTYGWIATRYQQKRPALGLVVTERSRLPARRVTFISLGAELEVESANADRLLATVGEARLDATLNPLQHSSDESLVHSVTVTQIA